MAQPILAAKTPIACAGCFAQYPDRLHVDYRAAFDGPQVPGSGPRSPHISWVTICEKCLRDGVALLPEEKGRVDALEQRIVDLEEQLKQTEAYADRVEDALASRPASRAAKPKAGQRRNRYEKDAA
jgi:hypothetical protein